MIKSISLKNITSYIDTGVQINDLKKVNFFFGYNGSGKSTIAKYLHDLSLDENDRNKDFENCEQTGYEKDKHVIQVFDEQFIEDNFNKSAFLKGVFSLNETNDIIDGKITLEENIIKNYTKYIDSKKNLKAKLETEKTKRLTELQNACWLERNIFNTFSKVSLPHSNSKNNNLLEIRKVLLLNSITLPTIENLKDTYSTLYEKNISEINSKIDKNIYKRIRLIETELSNLLSEVIIGNEDVDIALLIKSLDSRSWVEAGVNYIEKTDGVCPFCQQKTINESLKEQFNNFFDVSYKKKIESIKSLKSQYLQYYNDFLLNISETQNVFNPNNEVSNLYIKLKILFDNNKEVIEEKLLRPNEKKELEFLVSLKTEISLIIQKITQNNLDYIELDNKKNTFLSDIWQYMSLQCKENIEKYDKSIIKYNNIQTLAAELITSVNAKVILSNQNIEVLRTQTKDTKDAIDKINIILRNAGFEGFEIAEKEKVNNISQYYLKRNNSTNDKPVFKSLSEGEKTFISFLYFFQLCIGTDDIEKNGNKKKIIVIDDPVSSLDSQVLFIVSTLIHQLILRKGEHPKALKKELKNENIAQVFVLSHNLYFYKEVSLIYRPICTDYWHYRVIKENNNSKVTGNYNKTLFDDYTLLWNTLKEFNENVPVNKSQNVSIANTMRRVIESYVNFIGLGTDSWSAILNENPDDPSYYIKCAFISTINDESHKVSVLDSVYYQKLINEQPQILFDVFKQIFVSIGKNHYDMMMGINDQ